MSVRIGSLRSIDYRLTLNPVVALAASTSPVMTLKVRALASLTALTPTQARGQKIRLRVEVLAGPKGHEVTLQRKVDGAWRKVADLTLNTQGAATFTARATARGKTAYRVRTNNSTVNVSGFSDVVTVTVI